MKTKLKTLLRNRWTPYVFAGFFIICVTIVILISSVSHENDWYLHQDFRYKLERNDILIRNNLTLTNTYSEDYYFKIIELEGSIALLECDYAPESTLANIFLFLNNETLNQNTTGIHSYPQRTTFSQAISEKFFPIPLYSQLSPLPTTVECLVIPPIVVESEWDNANSSAIIIEDYIERIARIAFSNYNLSVEYDNYALSVRFSTGVAIIDDSENVNEGLLTLDISYVFTKGGTLKQFSLTKAIEYSDWYKDNSQILVQKQGQLGKIMISPQALISLVFVGITVCMVIVVKYIDKSKKFT